MSLETPLVTSPLVEEVPTSALPTALPPGGRLGFSSGHVLLRPRKRFRKLARFCLQFAFMVLLAFVSYVGASHYIATSVRVVGNSMYPTLHNTDRYLLNRWVYLFRAPRAGEIVVISDPADDRLSVKRVVATPGHTLRLTKQGNVFLDGHEIREPYLPQGTVTYPGGAQSEQTLVCGKGQFILLGDNRRNSADSRIYGPVPQARILGMIVQ